MNSEERVAFSCLINEDTILELQRIGELEDPEEQGYSAAPLILEGTGLADPQELLLRMQLAPRLKSPTLKDAKRDIGVMRWCLDNRVKK